MKNIFQFGEKVKGYGVRVLNDREVRVQIRFIDEEMKDLRKGVVEYDRNYLL